MVSTSNSQLSLTVFPSLVAMSCLSVSTRYRLGRKLYIVLEVQNFKNEKDEQTKIYLFILFYIFGRQSQRQIGYEKYEV